VGTSNPQVSDSIPAGGAKLKEFQSCIGCSLDPKPVLEPFKAFGAFI